MYVHRLNQPMELVHRLFVLRLDMVDIVTHNHFHMFLHLHDQSVVAERKKIEPNNIRFGLLK